MSVYETHAIVTIYTRYIAAKEAAARACEAMQGASVTEPIFYENPGPVRWEATVTAPLLISAAVAQLRSDGYAVDVRDHRDNRGA